MVALDNLPESIISKILSLACKDGGASGCSLSRTSRYIASLALPYLYQSVALSGVDQITRFLESPRVASSKNLPIRHLFVCDRQRSMAGDRCQYPLGPRHPVLPAHKRILERRYDVVRERHEADASEFAKKLVAVILKLSAKGTNRSLQTLSLIFFNPATDDVVWSATLNVPTPRLPELRRIHFATARSLMHIEKAWEENGTQPEYTVTDEVLFLAALCKMPRVSHLRISEIKLGAAGAGAYLARMLGLDFPPGRDAQVPLDYMIDAVPQLKFRDPARMSIAVETWSGNSRIQQRKYRFPPLTERKITVEERDFFRDAILTASHSTPQDESGAPHKVQTKPRIYDLGKHAEHKYDEWWREWLKRQQTNADDERAAILLS
ncbi:hypothetical protein GLOTRDRAFT_139287 [Gloeophyllum trabeum ATCC 11539]|uniref:Uncharacterized protein n=1 Tax=Gloeophyllum trabeum (strain ATCC 11539 / FP-39264 / Madison 617) TaxID=670483 RepID=S7RPK1_GLOTA|nr:uncharacterized protein GLOTRDRAFT_139287 [Gloeophyllum trabeum ATCC 11539]EPQ54794.1 hypothetical protein GLOTRDRAFT_139287 [Gloeophyllum trabeum ATCC 11539]